MKKMLMVLLMLCLMCAGSAMAESVSYIERSWDNSLKTVVGATNTLTDGSYTLVTVETTAWEKDQWYVAQGDVTIDTRVTVSGTVHLILCDDASLTVNGGIKVGTGTALVIYGQSDGTGALTASSTYDAGIGGDQGSENGGTVTIHGGEVHASSDHSAGIGGGQAKNGNGGAGGTVTVYGGVIHASSRYGAGIGGGQGSNGNGGDGGAVTVYGGEVHASSTYSGAGIGGGYGYMGAGGAGGTVTVYGGEVHASSSDYGAGIGGGYGSQGAGGAGGNVTIEGGVVYASGYDGAGIGGGSAYEAHQTGGNGGNVTISGGTVYATGSHYGAGIGGGGGRGEYGIGGDGGNVTISGGTVYATGGNYGAGIGGGGGYDHGSDSYAGKPGAGGTVMITGGVVYATGSKGAGIGGGCVTETSGGLGTGGNVTISGGTVYAASRYGIGDGRSQGGFGIGAGHYLRAENVNPVNQSLTIDPQGGKTIVVKQCVRDADLEKATVWRREYKANGSIAESERDKVFYAYEEDSNTGTYRLEFVANGGDAGSMYPLRLPKGQATSLPSCGFTRTGYTFTGWNTQADGSGRTYMLGELVSDLQPGDNGEVVTLYAQWQPNTYTVEFDANFGIGTMSNQEFTYDVEQALTKNDYTRINYFFTGWNTKEDGSGAAYEDGEKVKNLTADHRDYVRLYAQWQALPIEGNDKKVETQLLNEALTAKHLSGMPQGYNTLADVEAQMRGAAAQMGFLNGAQDGFIELRDVRLQQREVADGAYWIDVPKENFPAAGLTVTLEIPEGADVLTHDFLVVHMFTQEMNGRLPGAMEAFTPAIGEDGLTVTLNGCSPVGILWRVKPVDASALPQTGDPSSLMGWVCLLAMCAGAALVMKRARA